VTAASTARSARQPEPEAIASGSGVFGVSHPGRRPPSSSGGKPSLGIDRIAAAAIANRLI
jgi:hypothetical protein